MLNHHWWVNHSNSIVKKIQENSFALVFLTRMSDKISDVLFADSFIVVLNANFLARYWTHLLPANEAQIQIWASSSWEQMAFSTAFLKILHVILAEITF